MQGSDDFFWKMDAWVAEGWQRLEFAVGNDWPCDQGLKPGAGLVLWLFCKKVTLQAV